MTEDGFFDTAGTGSPAPAVSSSPAVGTSADSNPTTTPPDAARSPVDVVPPEARVELDRIRRRWAELPLPRAQEGMPVLRRLLGELGPRSAPEGVAVPDLGPAAAADQLAVLVWDAYAAGNGDGIPALLADARRRLG